MIKPTVGRVVWYYPNGAVGWPQQFPGHEAEPMAAVIAFVHNDATINLHAIDPHGAASALDSVLLLQEGETKPAPGMGYATWMPYQIEMAKKG
jgi:hypothetical protein